MANRYGRPRAGTSDSHAYITMDTGGYVTPNSNSNNDPDYSGYAASNASGDSNPDYSGYAAPSSNDDPDYQDPGTTMHDSTPKDAGTSVPDYMHHGLTRKAAEAVCPLVHCQTPL